MKEAIVVGAGVVGLTTALTLQSAGFNVRIISKESVSNTNSSRAGAIWFPYRCGEQAQANAWAMEGYAEFEKMASSNRTGVSMVSFLVLERLVKHDMPYWLGGVPKKAIRLAEKNELPATYQRGHFIAVPLIESPVYLPFLKEVFEANGGQIEIEEVLSLHELARESRWVINCSGLGARWLCQDKSVYPVGGQTVRVGVMPGVQALVDEQDDSLSYIIPRRDGIILGGTVEENSIPTMPNMDVTRKILQRCHHLQPLLGKAKILDAQVSVRPYRPTVRVEQEPGIRLIHNYGHGGAGFTLSWGTAFDVLRLVKQAG